MVRLQHRYWERFLRDLRFVVVDEAHMYTGVFGSHVAGVRGWVINLIGFRPHHGRRQEDVINLATMADDIGVEPVMLAMTGAGDASAGAAVPALRQPPRPHLHHLLRHHRQPQVRRHP